ncbi:hypothetical protein Maes01_01141 [Microbulbifer aestuariivivens]|uniref:Thioredoxin domain-containing protein n=1 Tax=Microbulbifer aestuariivivens TaxID=1908308 RepID=A0ABP9WMY6_9GAMM
MSQNSQAGADVGPDVSTGNGAGAGVSAGVGSGVGAGADAAVDIETAGEEKQERSPIRGLQGFALLAAVALPMVAACIVYYTGLGMPGGTVNQGSLLDPPIAVGHLSFVEQNDQRGQQVFSLGSAAPKWRYLVVPADSCDAACEKFLYTSRQVHIRLSEKADRVERLLVTASPLPAQQRAALAAQHPRLRFVQMDTAALQNLRTASGISGTAEPQALLVDQKGFAMMRYGNEHSGNQLLKDIKRLLKYSYEQ